MNQRQGRYFGFKRGFSAGRGALLLAAVLGLGLAFAEGLYFKPIPKASVALVNGIAISTNEYNHALLVLSQARRSAVSAEDRKHVLQTMIDNELLLQKAKALGLSQSHPEIRRALIQAMVNFILDNSSSTATPTDEELKAFHQKHRAWFQASERLQVKRIYFSRENKARAQVVAQALAREINQGRAFAKLQKKGEHSIALPSQPVPLETLTLYLGRELTRIASTLQVGKPSAMIETENGFYFLLVEKKLPALIPPFAQIKEQVKRQYKVSQDEKMLQDYIKNLRRQAQIEVQE